LNLNFAKKIVPPSNVPNFSLYSNILSAKWERLILILAIKETSIASFVLLTLRSSGKECVQHGTGSSSVDGESVSVITIIQTGGLDRNIVRNDTKEKKISILEDYEKIDTLLVGTHHEHGHSDEDDQVIIMEGFWVSTTLRTATASDSSTKPDFKKKDFKKIKACRHYNDHHHDCGRPGATINRHGKRCVQSYLSINQY